MHGYILLEIVSQCLSTSPLSLSLSLSLSHSLSLSLSLSRSFLEILGLLGTASFLAAACLSFFEIHLCSFLLLHLHLLPLFLLPLPTVFEIEGFADQLGARSQLSPSPLPHPSSSSGCCCCCCRCRCRWCCCCCSMLSRILLSTEKDFGDRFSAPRPRRNFKTRENGQLFLKEEESFKLHSRLCLP